MAINKTHKIDKFVAQLDGLSYLEVINYCNLEAARSRFLLRSFKPNDPREGVVSQYHRFVNETSYFFSRGTLPTTMSRADFLRLKPIAETLAARGEWRKDSLAVFAPRVSAV